MPTDLLSTDDLARLVGLQTQTIRKWRWSGRGPRWHRIEGGVVRYRAADVDAWLRSQRAA